MKKVVAMKKILISAIFLATIQLTILPVLSCGSSDTKGIITGGACSISELNSKAEKQNNEKEKTLQKNFLQKDLTTPTQKILCKYSLCPIFIEKNDTK